MVMSFTSLHWDQSTYFASISVSSSSPNHDSDCMQHNR